LPKQVLIDLLKLKNIYTGLGQVSEQYANIIEENIHLFHEHQLEPVFYLPKEFINSEKYKNIHQYTPKQFGRYVNSINPKVDVWHSLHQDPSHKPSKGSKHIVTVHDFNFIYEKEGLNKFRRLKKIESILKKADEVVAISNFVKLEVEKYIPSIQKSIHVIYNGVADFIQIVPIKPSNFSSDLKPFFFTVSHISAKKNLMVLLDMMKQTSEYNLVIAGQCNNQYGKELKDYIYTHKIENVKIIGPVSQAEKVWLYQSCEAFLFPSLYEGFGLPVIEALQFAKPVITSNCTSLPEIGGAYTAKWEHFEPSYMLEVVKKHINIPKNKDEIKFYIQEYSWIKNLEQYMKLYSL
jgi:glycosyltransferase involved in cell wall biosynthesis